MGLPDGFQAHNRPGMAACFLGGLLPLYAQKILP